MNDHVEVGSIIKGKVTGIQPYGAFISLDDDKQGLVHISEITNGYVKNINDFIKVGEEVSVKVLAIDEADGKISLSIKAVEELEREKQLRLKREINKSKLEHLSDASNQGFNTLKAKLTEWIEQSKNETLIEK
ncbi:S1 domain-containing post-transcriptional regulator GSP13 [Caldibacillus lycopersici]|uniref:S1 domain-containing post-transcriptional regulator GSP13 n=1 Tax=Perspicuibacillus lycopersici TaxID=1325689 RepID=A0AAE3ITZ6_9BACI|nr:S1 domain-containing post-transcriptional regulator GSP13 [Perspicuibacillus lycopersici]MCU9612764.1 S1 domain-containing post-transcriptional regulator GSP13 [Perspicuibacillus lycopersici]